MAWTTPRTWVAGELVTAAIGNLHWRDDIAFAMPGAIVDRVSGAGSSGLTTSTAPGTTIITGTTLPYDTSPVRVEAYVGGFYAVSEGQVNVHFYRGATDASGLINAHHNLDGAGSGQTSQKFEWVDTSPPGGSYAYSLRGWEPSAKSWGMYQYVLLLVSRLA